MTPAATADSASLCVSNQPLSKEPDRVGKTANVNIAIIKQTSFGD